jgi:RNA polymerase sigma factor (sigma-70 family)
MADVTARAGVPNHLGAILRFGTVGDLSDSQLLQQFLNGRDGADQAAFEALVSRHGPMVFSVCRRVLGNPHDAQDAFQATFLVMAKKAASVNNAESVASWLHGTALRVAMRAKQGEAKRRAHELRRASIEATQRDVVPVRSDFCPELHEEIARLPRRYREPVVLCYLEGLSSEQAAMRIGCPPGTVWSRLSRARERLRGSLVRRGVALPATLVAVSFTPRASAALPATLLDATVQSSLDFAGRRATEAALNSASALAIARGVLYAMTTSKLKVAAAATLACALALGGAQALNFGQFGLRKRSQVPKQVETEGAGSISTLSRSVDQLENALDETNRRNAEMRKDLKNIRAQVKALVSAPGTIAIAAAAGRFAGVLAQQSPSTVDRLVEQLRKNHVEPKSAHDRIGLYLMELSSGEVTLIADQPAPGLTQCGSPAWSHDGRRILYDATPGEEWSRTRLRSIELGDGRLTVNELGAGNCPTFSPADDRIVFLSNVAPQNGVWLMKADGSERKLLGDYGKPMWSPDGRQLMIMTFGDPVQVTIMDVDPARSGVLALPGSRFHSHGSWAGIGTIVAVIGPGQGDTVALIDVSDPTQARVKEVLWRRENGPDVEPTYPIYSPARHRCIFAGREAQGTVLYSVVRGEARAGKPLGPHGHDSKIYHLTYSPDARYILYALRGQDRIERARAPKG